VTRALLSIALLLMLCGCGAKSPSVSPPFADRAACAHATAVRKAIAHLRDFDVWGVGVLTSRFATAPLYPSYPDKLLLGKIGIAPDRRSGKPITVTAFSCDDDATIRLFQPSPGHANLDLPRPAPASAIANAGAPSVQLTWPPPVQSVGDPDRWFITPLFSKPGLAVLRFTEGRDELDRLTVNVCVGDASGRCKQD
jgi:predicted small lipoprotein YifL